MLLASIFLGFSWVIVALLRASALKDRTTSILQKKMVMVRYLQGYHGQILCFFGRLEVYNYCNSSTDLQIQ